MGRKQILANITLYEERVALLEDGVLAELWIERPNERGAVGNIYRGRVVRVLPGMQAAFVDIGIERTAFLYVRDVGDPVEDLEWGDTAVDEATRSPREHGPAGRSLPIEDLLKEGQEILVQVSKGPFGTKGARLTAHITLPGRHLVLMPSIDHVGVSRRIEDEAERKRLKDACTTIRPAGTGLIARTASEGKSVEDLALDLNYLLSVWGKIQAEGSGAAAPTLLHRELNLVQRTLRDSLTAEVDSAILDDKAEFERAREFVRHFLPEREKDIIFYGEPQPLFDAFGLEPEIAEALAPRVWLRSGGTIVIQQTEACVTIDVNTGRFVGRKNLEDTILKTNLEAVEEIVRQLRLRNIGGIIIIDFIDMKEEGNRDKTFQALQDALKRDRAKTNILRFSELGLVEMTRERSRPSLERVLCEPCTACEGLGRVKSVTTLCHEVLREIRRVVVRAEGKRIVANVHPEVFEVLTGKDAPFLEAIEKDMGVKIIPKACKQFTLERYEVSAL